MAGMKTKKLDENEIDRRVIEQVDDDAAWGKPVKVKRDKTSLTLPVVHQDIVDGLTDKP